ncbi:MAG: DUF488 domain-containing protein [Alloalcanivorax venustensis]|jgi:uncharacterized protein YeaO (DUF488 family)|uniref:DUF488 domain-containing protein n=1 Tax=Alloalcanivorax venustensis TaxID=172371 RepID=UPI003297E400
MKQPHRIQCKRVYDGVEKSDGHRVLVDRVWPRGIKKETLQADEWRKELSPSSELRKWFNHDPQRWAAFYQKFHAELEQQGEAVESVLKGANGGTLTLLYAAKDTEHNNAVALKMYLEKQ